MTKILKCSRPKSSLNFGCSLKYSHFRFFSRKNNTRIIFEISSREKYSQINFFSVFSFDSHILLQNGQNKQTFLYISKKILAWFYSHFNNLLAWFFTRTYRKFDKCSLFPRFFLFFSRFALSRAFFFLALFSSHARKKRICEEKKNLCTPPSPPPPIRHTHIPLFPFFLMLKTIHK